MKKILFSMLALLLAMGGAWAQGPTVTELTVPDNWSNDFTPLTAADLPGFVAVDSATADQWVYASTSGYAVLIYAFTTDGKAKYVLFDLGDKLTGTNLDRITVHQLHGNSTQLFYTTGGGAIKLTPDATGKVWTLDETPDYNLDLNVVYYQKFALKDIPAGWQVKVDGVDKTAAIDGDSLKITETAQVLLTPDHPERVKKVILVDEAVLVNIDGITLDITGCTTWADIIARNNGVIWDDGGWIGSGSGILLLNFSGVSTSDTYIPSANYKWSGA